MNAKWGICVFFVALLALTSGCRTPQPNIKPEKTAEQFNEPPANTYMSSTMPKQAFTSPNDPVKANIDPKNSPMMPGRGSMMSTSGSR